MSLRSARTRNKHLPPGALPRAVFFLINPIFSAYTEAARVLPANEQLPQMLLRSNRYRWNDGRLLLFAVTNLDNEANNCDYEHAKLEHVRVCDHNPLPPFLSVGGRKKTFSLRKTRWGPPACRLSVAPLLNYHIFPQKATPIPTGTGALFDSFCVLLYHDVAR